MLKLTYNDMIWHQNWIVMTRFDARIGFWGQQNLTSRTSIWWHNLRSLKNRLLTAQYWLLKLSTGDYNNYNGSRHRTDMACLVFCAGKRSKKCKAATDSHLVLLSDPNIQESSACLHDSQAALKDQWRSESHSLDQGKFVRGKKPESGACLDPRSRYQWLGFGGGQREGSGGVIDAFTSK